MTPEQILQEAKEKVAKESGFESWHELSNALKPKLGNLFDKENERAAILALKLQAEEYEKVIREKIERWNRVSDEQIKDIGGLAIENEQLKAKLEKEKVKAFDEGVDSAISSLGLSSMSMTYPKDYNKIATWLTKGKLFNPYKPA